MSHEGCSSSPTDSPAAGQRVRLPVLRATGSDHAAVACFLQSVFHGLPPEEFQASLDDPFYEPHDRLLLRQRRRIVAHVQIAPRTMRFGSAKIPVANVAGLAVAAEHRGRRLATHLLREAERQMRADGALIGFLRTSCPQLFLRNGWAICEQASSRHANVFALLARLVDHGFMRRRRRGLHIRPWLKWEQPAIARVYADSTAQGPLERTDACWHWLLNRHAYDRLYVALEGPELLEVGEVTTRVVGYAVVRGDHIIELITDRKHRRTAIELLGRCCDDAIESDRQCVVLHGPPSSRLFKMFDEAGRAALTAMPDRGEVCMMRLLDPAGLLRQLGKLLNRRAWRAGLRRPCELGLLVEGRKLQLELAEKGLRVSSQRMGRSYLALNAADFARLLLGQLDWNAALAAGRLQCSTALAAEAGRAMFPPLPFWRPPWDDLPARPGGDLS
jgi:predicted N-acetyltransferase YhbS